MARRTVLEVAAQRTTVATSTRAKISRRRSTGMGGGGGGGSTAVVPSWEVQTRLGDDMAVPYVQAGRSVMVFLVHVTSPPPLAHYVYARRAPS